MKEQLQDNGFFATTDKVLASALLTAGCRPAPQDKEGPAINTYTPELLRSRGIIGEKCTGSEFERRGTEQFQQGRAGIVTYLIVRDETFTKAIAAWDAMVVLMQKRKDAEDARAEIPPLPVIEEAVAMQVQFFAAMNADAVKKLPFFQSPRFQIAKMSTEHIKLPNRDPKTRQEPSLPGTRDISTGSMKVWNSELSNESRKELGIHPRPL